MSRCRKLSWWMGPRRCVCSAGHTGEHFVKRTYWFRRIIHAKRVP
jgi:hypothetical protein